MADIIDLMLATGCRIGEVLALRWSDLDLDGDLPILTVSGTIKTETGKGTYRKATPKTDTSRRTVVLPRFAAELLRVRREFATPTRTTPSSPPATAPGIRSSTSSGGGLRSAGTPATSG
jgi:integrase